MSLESIEVPGSSETRVVIPSNSTLSGFLRNCYLVNQVPILANYIGRQDFDQIISDCSKILSTNYTLKKEIQKGKITNFEKILFAILAV